MRLYKVLLIPILSLLLFGCTVEPKIPEGKNPMSGTLNIMYTDEDSFMNDFGKLFNFYYPNIQFEIISTPQITNSDNETDSYDLEQFISTNIIDLVFVNKTTYHKLSTSGTIDNIEQKIMKDRDFDLQQFVDPVIDILRYEGGGYLYGLAPFFHSRVLYYNMDLFDKYGIEYPTDNMTWDQIFEIASFFPSNGSTAVSEYGLYHPFTKDRFNPYRLVSMIAQTENLSFVNTVDKKINLKDTRYEQLLNYVIQGLQDKSIYTPMDSDNKDKFITGNAAMRYEGYFYLNKIQTVPFEWDIVSEPIGLGGQSVNYYIDDIFSITTASTNKDIGWEFLKFVNSEKFLEIKARSRSNYGLPVLKRIANNYMNSQHHYESFYSLMPFMEQSPLSNETPLIDVQLITQEQTIRALEGEITVEEAVEYIEKKLQEQLK